MNAEPTGVNPERLRPRDLALFLLSSKDLLPRRRARDQQADLAGMKLKRELLNRLVMLDPEPDELESALMQIVDETGPPTGPTRALAIDFRDEWQGLCSAEERVTQLLAEGLQDSDGP